ncbi:hypothetical protein immuto35A_222 [Flavobacterium phage vB_FspM_immuto_3-5A]|uniref:Uncharacterized protein n=1 Tax=Flavobacterium phage vB_FspM_immuto_2-6A TaxID=2801477 RepID=A0A7T8ESB3_9CAUD|nr:hypothetical protein KNV73_gp048 [Flavobacterium phage vB_FspM_immuto_2-6A]QQO91902.1 hypothetical protein immuto26A_223 [Flavobacterium phage vB_FspM_immuto_2-6A]QQO92140.1 hypothetical protein immuto35A_222 [Flavobacterium phage vB_FspM_immuto_3-5A]QQO92378.1 hypothetical protein immuto136C_222 [Flavobacterium phage vB_FspM_immuto_13-6C]
MSTFANRRWLIIPTTLTGSIDFNQVLESSPQSLRLSVDGTKTFIKYEINEVLEDQIYTGINPETGEETTSTTLAGVYGRPSIYSEEYTEYTHEEILTILSTEEWTTPMQEIE